MQEINLTRVEIWNFKIEAEHCNVQDCLKTEKKRRPDSED